MVLIHAGVCDSRMWEPQWASFCRGHRMVRYRPARLGDSAPLTGPYSRADDLVALLRRLHLERVSLVGASVGGRAAIEVALAHPELVQALVVVGAPLPVPGAAHLPSLERPAEFNRAVLGFLAATASDALGTGAGLE